MYILFLNGMIFGNEHGEGAIIPLLELAKKIPADGVMKVAPFFLHVIIPVGWFSFYLIQELKGEDSSTIFISFAALLVGLLAIHFFTTGKYEERIFVRSIRTTQIIPEGSFTMGDCAPSEKKRFMGIDCNASGPMESPQRTVHIRAFRIGSKEVTLGQFKEYIRLANREDLLTHEFMAYNTNGDDAPVLGVSWDDAQEFIQWLNGIRGPYKSRLPRWRLPTEAEWEYACRAQENKRYCGSDKLDAVGWFAGNSMEKPNHVAQKAPNAFGLYDMSGNAWELVQDCWHDSYHNAPTDGSAWEGRCHGNKWVIRGGSWNSSAEDSRAAARKAISPEVRSSSVGLRLVEF